MISTIKPHMAASQNTISKWVKLILSKAGIDSSFTTHSTRAAASSVANLKSVPLQTICGVVECENIAKLYKKPLELEESSIQSAI